MNTRAKGLTNNNNKHKNIILGLQGVAPFCTHNSKLKAYKVKIKGKKSRNANVISTK